MGTPPSAVKSSHREDGNLGLCVN